MNSLNKILKLCKMSGTFLHEDLDGTFSLYTPTYKLIIGKTDLNEALYSLRQYLKNPQVYFKNRVTI